MASVQQAHLRTFDDVYNELGAQRTQRCYPDDNPREMEPEDFKIYQEALRIQDLVIGDAQEAEAEEQAFTNYQIAVRRYNTIADEIAILRGKEPSILNEEAFLKYQRIREEYITHWISEPEVHLKNAWKIVKKEMRNGKKLKIQGCVLPPKRHSDSCCTIL